MCQCECGNKTEVRKDALKAGRVKSCGCKKKRDAEANATRKKEEKERRKKERESKPHPNARHGMWKTPEYKAWQSLKQRCNNENCHNFKDYGGRGISVCDRWMNSFENFYEDMGDRPGGYYSIDRIDVDGDYEQSNCRWATRSEQQKNRRCSPKNR